VPLSTVRTKHRARREEYRQTILLAADRFLRARPYRELTVEALMADTGVTRTSFYRHFDGLPDVVLAMLDGADTELTAIADAWARRGDPLTSAADALTEFVAFFARHGPVIAAIALSRNRITAFLHSAVAAAAAAAARAARDEAQGELGAVAARREAAEEVLARRTEQREALAQRVYRARSSAERCVQPWRTGVHHGARSGSSRLGLGGCDSRTARTSVALGAVWRAHAIAGLCLRSEGQARTLGVVEDWEPVVRVPERAMLLPSFVI